MNSICYCALPRRILNNLAPSYLFFADTQRTNLSVIRFDRRPGTKTIQKGSHIGKKKRFFPPTITTKINQNSRRNNTTTKNDCTRCCCCSFCDIASKPRGRGRRRRHNIKETLRGKLLLRFFFYNNRAASCGFPFDGVLCVRCGGCSGRNFSSFFLTVGFDFVCERWFGACFCT